MKFLILIFILITPSVSYTQTVNVENLEKTQQSLLKVEETVVEIKKESSNHSEKLDLISKKLNESNFLWDFLMSLSNSILAAFIFWLGFNKIPYCLDKKRIRPKIEVDLYHIYMDLFFIFDSVMRENKMSSTSLFQQEIKFGELTKEQIELGLQNKSLNKSCLYGKCQENIVIGKDLYEYFSKIDSNIDRIFQFNKYLATKDEILLLENIHQNITQYNLKNHSDSVVDFLPNDVAVYPQVPNLSYLSESIYELYKLYIRLQKIIMNIKNIHTPISKRNLVINKLEYFYRKKEYRKLNSTIKESKKILLDQNDKRIKVEYIILLKYSTKKSKAYTELRKFMKNPLKRIDAFFPLINDPEVQKILLENGFQEEDISKLKKKNEDKKKRKSLFLDYLRHLKNS